MILKNLRILKTISLVSLISLTTAQAQNITEEIFSKQGIKLIFIKGGTFTMGSPESEPDRYNNEIQQKITLGDFYLSEKEITNEQYCYFLNAENIKEDGRFEIPGFKIQTLIIPHKFGVQYSNGKWHPAPGKNNYPVVRVSWFGAKAYCDWAGGRLPTEAEWEYACRAGTATPFHTGKNLATSQANYNGHFPYAGFAKGTNLRRTQPVGSYAPNAWGLYDMHGNVWEWCVDWYISDKLPNSERCLQPSPPSRWPYRVLRGGSWGVNARGCRSAERYGYGPRNHDHDIGFRIAYSY